MLMNELNSRPNTLDLIFGFSIEGSLFVFSIEGRHSVRCGVSLGRHSRIHLGDATVDGEVSLRALWNFLFRRLRSLRVTTPVAFCSNSRNFQDRDSDRGFA
jgi:hypothetical protein